jgi:hypothetical protein
MTVCRKRPFQPGRALSCRPRGAWRCCRLPGQRRQRVAHPARVSWIGHLLQALQQARALAGVRRAGASTKIPKLLQGRTDQR